MSPKAKSPQPRRSQRIRDLTLKKADQNVIQVNNMAKTPKKKAPKMNLKSSSKIKSKPTSILKGASRMRGRSKSVSFDSKIVSVSPVHQVTPVRRNLFGDSNRSLQKGNSSMRGRSISIDSHVIPAVRHSVFVHPNRQFQASGSFDLPLDLTVSSPAARSVNLVQNVSIENQTNETPQQHDVSIQCMMGQTVALDSRYEARIDALIESNEVKIGRIKELRSERDLAEKEAFLAEIATLHRINRNMGETIDEFREGGNDLQPTIDQNSQIDQLNENVQMLKERVRRLNEENFGLHNSNGRLTACLLSHSKDIMEEHNYKMCF